MGRNKKVPDEVQAPAIEQTESEVAIIEPEIVSENGNGKKVFASEHEYEAMAMQKKIKELEIKLKEKENEGGLDELLKRPNFGTKSYLHLLMENLQDPNNPNKFIPVVAMISVFPNALDPSEIDPETKKPRPLCPDIGVTRELGDKIRNSDVKEFEHGINLNNKKRMINCLTEYNGKVMLVKEAVRLIQLDYLRRKKEGDERHKLEMDKITRASE